MIVALIQFREVGKKYYFQVPENLNLTKEDLVIVETSVGTEIGSVYMLKDSENLNLNHALKPIKRIATADDLIRSKENEISEGYVVDKTKSLVKKLKLKMQILEAEYTLDKRKLTIYFEADGRVDFRDLVRELNKEYQTRIELRQIGPRDVAKKIGGIGPCGLVLCCTKFIGDFKPVTIKMAKNQNISLNPKKMSGLCGKLMCCIRYENDTYTQIKKEMPDLYSKYETPKGVGKIIDMNLVSGRLKIKYRDTDLATEWIKYNEETSS